MSRAVARRFRVRIATRGATEVDGYVEFTLDAGIDSPDHPLAKIPVVAGSFVHPLDGATELRPLHVEALDLDGALIQAFVANQRWTAIGRLVDIQYQLASSDPYYDAWTTYGTGRCSGLDELDGPGKFRVEISDESWISRKHRLFETAGTTSLWPYGLAGPDETAYPPSGVPLYTLGEWKGFPPVTRADGTILSTSGTRYKIELTGDPFSGRIVPSQMVEWARKDLLADDETNPPPAGFLGYFKFLRLRYKNNAGDWVDWEIVTFGTPGNNDFLETLSNPTILNPGAINQQARITVWVEAPSGQTPNATSTGHLYAPDAPPDDAAPLHIPVVGMGSYWGTNPANFLWGTQPGTFGFIHVADLTRRVWQLMNERYDEASLYVIESDLSFPALGLRITEIPENPEKFMQERVWGPLMLLALKDAEGRRKLKDIRPPSQNEDFSSLPRLDNSNSKEHRWRLVGRDMVNFILWQYQRLTYPNIYLAPASEPPEPDALDGFLIADQELDPAEGDTVDFIGQRKRIFDVSALLADPTNLIIISYCQASGAGVPFVGAVVTQQNDYLLTIYQDGPMQGTCEIEGPTAETLEEGDYVLVDCDDVKIANPGRYARAGLVLVLLLSLTRYPAHAEAEYLIVRPVDIFLCPLENDSTTWLVSPLNELTTMRLALGYLTEPYDSPFTLEIVACKNEPGGQQVNMQVVLYDGATILETWDEYDLTAVATEFQFAIDTTTHNSLSDWTNLFVEITRGGDTGGAVADYRSLQIRKVGVA